MAARARVGRIHSDRRVELELVEPPRCRGCEGVCTWRWSRVGALPLTTDLSLQPGEVVRLVMPTQRVLQGALLLHGLPWGGLVVGAAAGVAGLGGDLGCLLGAVAGLALGLFLARRIETRWQVAATLTVIPRA